MRRHKIKYHRDQRIRRKGQFNFWLCVSAGTYKWLVYKKVRKANLLSASYPRPHCYPHSTGAALGIHEESLMGAYSSPGERLGGDGRNPEEEGTRV